MKLNFSIRYKTPFGQSMHVCIRYIDKDGHVRDVNEPMRTDDGDTWTVETAGIVFTHVPIRYLVYTYQVEDDACSAWMCREITSFMTFGATCLCSTISIP